MGKAEKWAYWLNILNMVGLFVTLYLILWWWNRWYITQMWQLIVELIPAFWALIGIVVSWAWHRNCLKVDPYRKNCVAQCVTVMVFGTPLAWAAGIIILVRHSKKKKEIEIQEIDIDDEPEDVYEDF